MYHVALCKSPHIYTRLALVVVATLRTQGISIVLYPDDWLVKQPQRRLF